MWRIFNWLFGRDNDPSVAESFPNGLQVLPETQSLDNTSQSRNQPVCQQASPRRFGKWQEREFWKTVLGYIEEVQPAKKDLLRDYEWEFQLSKKTGKPGRINWRKVTSLGVFKSGCKGYIEALKRIEDLLGPVSRTLVNNLAVWDDL